jgi:hypothetical protein
LQQNGRRQIADVSLHQRIAFAFGNCPRTVAWRPSSGAARRPGRKALAHLPHAPAGALGEHRLLELLGGGSAREHEAVSHARGIPRAPDTASRPGKARD